MSIESAIENAQQKVANAYTAVENKGGTLPATQNLSNLPTAINTISTAGTVETLNVTPSTSAQTFTASGGVDGYSPVTVSAVTSSIDSDIKATNIKSGVTILGVTGSVTELAGETRSVSLTNSAGQTFTPTSGKNGITSITVTPNNQARTVTPTTSSQSLTVNSGYSGNGTITVNAVTSAIDQNIVAGNIKNGVTILGTTGNYTGTTPTGTLNITQNGTYDVTNYASADVNVSGGGGSKYGATGGTFLGNVDANGVLSYDADIPTYLVFTGVRDLGDTALNLRFTYTTYTANIQANRFVGLNSIKSASFPDLENISGKHAMNYTFSNCENFASLSMPNLTSISGNYAMNAMCNKCISLNSVNFAKLESITGSYALRYAFQYCLQLTTLSFSSLTSTGFGSNTNQFNNMLSDVTGCTVHFPSNLQSVIGSWSSVTSGFGGTNTTVLFDLPATT